MGYLTYQQYYKIIVVFPRLFLCGHCSHSLDTGEGLHFNVCEVEGVCVDCEPNTCKGKDFKKKERRTVF